MDIIMFIASIGNDIDRKEKKDKCEEEPNRGGFPVVFIDNPNFPSIGKKINQHDRTGV